MVERRGSGVDTVAGPSDAEATIPAEASATTDQPEPERGEQLGRYLVLSELGQGSMGVVLAAYDPKLDRKVALKLIKAKPGKRETARARLEREAQALARLDHPNVVRVHDVGEHQGQVFVAMEFVEGQTVREWMSEGGKPRPWAEVLQVFGAAGRGIAAAHEAGMIHRDIKPDNMMIGSDGRVRVMDFGLVRADDEELDESSEAVEGTLEQVRRSTGSRAIVNQVTRTGIMMGTPAYMALEQFEGRTIDARTDQFGYCVSLYEALYGERPFFGQTSSQILAALSDGSINPAPKTSSVPAWVRAVVVRGLSKDPGERFESMRALLAALADDPRERRRRWLITAGAIVLLVGGLAALVMALRQQPAPAPAPAPPCQGMDDKLAGVWDDARRAEVRGALERTGLSNAGATAERVEARLDDYTHAWVAGRTEACEATRIRGEQSTQLLDLRMACLDERLLHLRATVELLASADDKLVNRAVRMVAGLPGLERCADFDALRSEEPPPEDPEVAAAVERLEARLVEAKALRRAGRNEDGQAIADAIVAEASELGYEPLLVRAWLQQAALWQDAGNYEGAVTAHRQAYQLAVARGMAIAAANASAQLMYDLGSGLSQPDEARRWAFHAGPLAERAGTDRAQLEYINNMGTIELTEGNYAAARGLFERGLALETATFGPDDVGLLTGLNNLGYVAYLEGEYDEAGQHWQRMLDIAQRSLGPEHPDVADALSNLGAFAGSQGDHVGAREYFERALAIQEKLLGRDSLMLAITLTNLGITAREAGDYDQARAYFERSLDIRTQALGAQHREVGGVLVDLGALAAVEGDYEEARAQLQRALAILQAAVGPDHPEYAEALGVLADTALREGEYAEARTLYAKTLSIREQVFEDDNPRLAGSLTGLGAALVGLGRAGEAVVKLERALVIRSASAGDPADLAETRFELARALWDAPGGAGRDRERALTLANEARQVLADAGKAEKVEELDGWLRGRGQG